MNLADSLRALREPFPSLKSTFTGTSKASQLIPLLRSINAHDGLADSVHDVWVARGLRRQYVYPKSTYSRCTLSPYTLGTLFLALAYVGFAPVRKDARNSARWPEAARSFEVV